METTTTGMWGSLRLAPIILQLAPAPSACSRKPTSACNLASPRLREGVARRHKRCAAEEVRQAYMSHDIPSRARAIIAFLGVETGYGARIKALACTLIGVGGVRPRD